MPTFNEIKQQKYNTPPWDRADNPMGFPAIATIDHKNHLFVFFNTLTKKGTSEFIPVGNFYKYF